MGARGPDKAEEVLATGHGRDMGDEVRIKHTHVESAADAAARIPAPGDVDINARQERNDEIVRMVEKALFLKLAQIRMRSDIAMIVVRGADKKDDIGFSGGIHQHMFAKHIERNRLRQPVEVASAVGCDRIVRSTQQMNIGHPVYFGVLPSRKAMRLTDTSRLSRNRFAVDWPPWKT
jgi:hypothetical protein